MRKSVVSDLLAVGGILLMIGGDLVFLFSYRGWILPSDVIISSGGLYAVMAGSILQMIYEWRELPANEWKLSFKHSYDERVLWIVGKASYTAFLITIVLLLLVVALQVTLSISLTFDLTAFVVILCAALGCASLHYYERKYRGEKNEE